MHKFIIAIALAISLIGHSTQIQAQSHAEAWESYYKQDTAKAIEQFSDKADKDAKSAFITYLLEKENAKSDDDLKKAEKWLDKAANMGSPEALYTVAVNDYHNKNKLLNGIQIIDRLQKAADAGLPQANLALGVLYTLSEYENLHDIDKGIQYVSKAHKQEYKFATLILGILNLSDLKEMGLDSEKANFQQDAKKGLSYLESILSEDFVWPAIILADVYENGANGIDPNPQKAQEFDDWISDNFFQIVGDLDITDPEEISPKQMLTEKEKQSLLTKFNKQAKSGDATAARTLGNIYQKGKLTNIDKEKSHYYYKMAAELNDPISIMALAEQSKSKEKLDYLEQAAKLNHVPALRELSEIYTNSFWSGVDIEEDEQLALEYMEKAAQAGDFQSQIDVANLYSKGEHTNFDKAKEWLKQSIKEHPKQASRGYLKLAELYSNEKFKQYNQDKAFHHLEKSLEAGDKTGQAAYLLANLYEEGVVVDADPEKALKLYELASSDQDNSLVYDESMLAIANIYINGSGNIKKDAKKSIQILENLAKDDVIEAIYQLGDIYRTGNGVTQNHTKAKQYYKEIADYSEEADIRLKLIELDNLQGKAYAQTHQEILNLADYTYEKDVLKDVYATLNANEHDLNWLYSEASLYKDGGDALPVLAKFATGKNLPIAHYYYGLALLKNDKTTQLGLGEIKTAANQGNHKAMRDLGNFYLGHYNILDENEELALEWLHRAAKAKGADDKIFKDLGDIYYKGLEHTEKDYAKALNWYSKITKESLANDDYFYPVRGNIEDLQQAINNINEAQDLYEQGDMDAAYKVANWHLNNKYGLNNKEKAFELLIEAAKNKHVEALWFLANDAEFKNKINEQQRTEYYKLAAQNGHFDAKRKIGERYLYGKGTDIDREQAKYWFSKANYDLGLKRMARFEEALAKAKQNDTKASFKVGLHYKQGTGTAINYQKAKHYFEIAAEKNNQAAQLELAKLYINGFTGKIDWQKAMFWAKRSTDGYDQAQEYINYYENTVKLAENGDPAAMARLAQDNLYEFYSGSYKPIALFEYAQDLLDKAITKENGLAAYLKAKSYDDSRSPYYKHENAKEKYAHYLDLAAKYDYANAQVAYGDYLSNAGKLDLGNQAQIIELYKDAAKQDNHTALRRLLDIYYYGSSNGFEQQIEKIKPLLQDTCDSGQNSACMILAEAYAHGLYDFKPDGKRAIALLKNSMANDKLESYLMAGEIYIKGSGHLKSDWDKADINFAKAHAIGLQELKQNLDEYIQTPDTNRASAAKIADYFMTGLRELGDNADKEQVAITAKWQEQAVNTEGYMDLATNWLYIINGGYSPAIQN